MDALLYYLVKLHDKKRRAGLPGMKKIISKQLSYLNKLITEEAIGRKIVEREIKKIRDLELHKEYNISIEDFNKLVKEKDVEVHFAHIFFEELKPIREELEGLEEALRQQLSFKGNFNTLITSEEKSYEKLKVLFDELELSKSRIRDYFKDISHLTYNKRSIRTNQAICKFIKNVFFKIDVQGIENIPLHGPCIIAPHHHNAAFDPIVLISLINRHLFFLTSVETFVAIPLYDKVLYSIGCLPFKRDESRFNARLEKAVPLEKVQDYDSSNLASLKKMINHLKYGDAIVMFPEAEAKINPTYARPDDEDFLPPQEGFLELSMLAERRLKRKIPIIPIGLKYANSMGSKVTVRVGKPVYVPNEIQILTKSQLKLELTRYSNYVFDIIKRLSL